MDDRSNNPVVAPTFYDVTLRDGNHALRHQLSKEFVKQYCALADKSDAWAVEVGHGNGLGASSYLVGKSATSDHELLETAREHLSQTKLAVHAIPGMATIRRDLKPAISLGVEVFRIATHVTEASVAQTHIEFLAEQERIVHGVLMMSHMCTTDEIVRQASQLIDYGASAVILMDSAGNYLPNDVRERVGAIREDLGVTVGFHAHNNLGVGVTNALTAFERGATIIDGSSMGLGAGSGNAQLEAIVANMSRGHIDGGTLRRYLAMSQLVEQEYFEYLPRINGSSIQSGLAGVFSGYSPQVINAAREFGLDPADLWNEIGRRRLVAGQETMIREIAQDLRNL